MALILAMLGFSRMSHNDLLIYARAVVKGMTGSLAFPDPPVDLGIFAAAVEAFHNAIIDALDGANSARAARDSARDVVIQYMRQLTPYVETKSEGEMATFLSSGFRPKTKGTASERSAEDPFIRKILHGQNSGSLCVYIKASVAVWSYFLRYAEVDGYETGSWTEIPIAKVKSAVVISLKPATRYTFQVRGLRGDGTYSDWSSSVNTEYAYKLRKKSWGVCQRPGRKSPEHDRREIPSSWVMRDGVLYGERFLTSLRTASPIRFNSNPSNVLLKRGHRNRIEAAFLELFR